MVDLSEEHIDALAEAYPPPRYYADPVQWNTIKETARREANRAE